MEGSYQIKDLYKSGDYQAIADLRGDPEAYDRFTEWDHNYLLLALNKLNRYSECLEAYKKMRQRYPSSRLGNSTVTAALYNAHFRNCDPAHCDLDKLKKQLDFIIRHDEEPSSPYSKTWPAMKAVLKAVTSQTNSGKPQALLAILGKADPKALSDKEGKGTRDGKEVTFASPREEWYAEETKALLSASLYEQCVSCVDDALRQISVFHYNNDIWFKKRKARALTLLGRIDEARGILQELAVTFSSEWIYKDLFSLETQAGDTQRALFYGCQCAYTGVKSDSIGGFSNQFAVFLMRLGMEEMAMLERQLAVCLEKETSDQPKPFAAEWEPTEAIAALSKKQIIDRLRPMWLKVIDSSKAFYEGEIVSLNAEKRLGNILGPDGKRYFFKFNSVRSRYSELREGRKVRFATEKRFDKKKQVWDMNAVDITVLE